MNCKVSTFITIGALALLPISCKKTPSDEVQLSVNFEHESVTEFHRFLDTIKLRLSEQKDTQEILVKSDNRQWVFRSLKGFPLHPLKVHISPGQVATGTGPSREELTVNELERRLKRFVDGASASGHEGILLLISDKGVTGDFGGTILNAIADSGINTIMVTENKAPEDLPAAQQKKPSPPYSK